jgi:hypothetical protein
MTGEEAREYGLVDKVLMPSPIDLSKIGRLQALDGDEEK